MDCAEIRRGFVDGLVPEGPAVSEHLKVCPHCRELFENGAELGRRLARAVLPAAPPGELFGAVERDLKAESGLHAQLRALPSWLRAASLVVLAIALFWFHLRFDARTDFLAYGLDVFAMVSLGLLLTVVWGAVRLVRGVSRPARGEGALALLLLTLPIVLMFVVPLGQLAEDPAHGWGSPSECFSYGAGMVLPLVALAWLFERRDRIPVPTLVAMGALAGVAANLLLNAHCASVHLGHLMLGHASIGVAWALALLLLARILRSKE